LLESEEGNVDGSSIDVGKHTDIPNVAQELTILEDSIDVDTDDVLIHPAALVEVSVT
jgi:hypothetical protein